VLSTDAVEAFREAPGGLYDPGVAQRLRREIMRVGNSVDPAIAYRNFRGRDPDVAAYLRDKGFPTA
jgi:peptidyl-dipeptidase Dcp